MGVVYEARDNLNRSVALKMLRVDRIDAAELPEITARFRREAESLARLAHPHIVTIHDYGNWNGSPYLVMEFMQGRDLAKELKASARFPLDVVVRIMTQLLGALSHAHERGVIHRDLKPANMFLLEDGSLKIVDFGLARLEDSALGTLTKTPTVMGTPAYMSPEQVDALPTDHRSDLFSAGVILYELLTGEKPFKGDSSHSIQQAVRKLDPLTPSDANPTLSPVWDKVIARVLAKKPTARYESARQFLEAIKDAHQAERAHAEESRLKAAEASEHALRAAEERSRAESIRRLDDERREAERVAKAESPARVAATESAMAEAKRLALVKATQEAEEMARQAVNLERLKKPSRAIDPEISRNPGSSAAPGAESSPRASTAGEMKSVTIVAIIAVITLTGGLAAYITLRTPPAPVSVATAPISPVQTSAPPMTLPVRANSESPKSVVPKAEVVPINQRTEEQTRREAEESVRREVADKAAREKVILKETEERIRRETEERIRREFAEKAEREKVIAKEAVAKKSAEKFAADKQAAEKNALDNLAAAKVLADKAVAEKSSAEKEAAVKAAALASASVPQKVRPMSWMYVTEFRHNDGVGVADGVMSIEEVHGKAILKFAIGNSSWQRFAGICFRGVGATVVYTKTTTTIKAKPDMRGCDEFRFVIKNDGTGGQQFVQRGGEWVSDGFDHRLTPVM